MRNQPADVGGTHRDNNTLNRRRFANEALLKAANGTAVVDVLWWRGDGQLPSSRHVRHERREPSYASHARTEIVHLGKYEVIWTAFRQR